MLSRFDDYPIHQTAEPIARPAQSDRHVYDRYWLNGFADDGEFYFGVGMGSYPNLGVLDCGLSVVHGNEQHSFHASRRAPQDPSETVVGPFRIEVVEPMRSLRLILDSNETGIACDLTFTARTACIEEGRQTYRMGSKLIMDATRFAQFGRWQGTLEYGGQRMSVDATRVLGTKDRSWGVRPVGDPAPPGAPPTQVPGIYFVWAPIHWDDICTHLGVFEDSAGHAWHQDGAIAPAYTSLDAIPGIEDPGLVRLSHVDHQIEYQPGTRRAASATLGLVEPGGRRHDISLEPLLCFRMKGIGYNHPEWGHGRWKGELAVGGEVWKDSDLDPLALDNLHIQQVVRARMGDREGVGVMEQLCIGPHAPSGFEGFLDGAKG